MTQVEAGELLETNKTGTAGKASEVIPVDRLFHAAPLSFSMH